MAAIDFTKKGLNQMIFAKKTVSATAGRNSSAFKEILADKNVSNVINKAGEKKVFYDALKKRGMSAGSNGITKNVFKKVLGDIEHSGEFSHNEMMDLRKHLVGGSVSSSIIRENKSAHIDDKSNNHSSRKSEVNMRKIYDEIMSKRKNISQETKNEALNYGKSHMLNFGM
ncbi:MAG: hypothetical protein US57_C0028G0010, partial [Candidatus Moranbacteria bacterium GW2011_GWC2_37_73]